MNILFGLLTLALFASGFFDYIPWKFNIPAVLVLAVIWLVMMYNSLVTLTQRVKNAWADIDVQLKRRYDLIPNLVNTVKGSSNFETSTLEKVVEARAKAMGAGTTAEHAQAENMLSGALKSIFALAESYPDLKSNQNYLSLQSELSDTENKIQAARRFYNSNVMEYNTVIQVVPTNIIAKMFSFGEKEFFELNEGEDAARNPVEVKF
jgi:LemA protein